MRGSHTIKQNCCLFVSSAATSEWSKLTTQLTPPWLPSRRFKGRDFSWRPFSRHSEKLKDRNTVSRAPQQTTSRSSSSRQSGCGCALLWLCTCLRALVIFFAAPDQREQVRKLFRQPRLSRFQGDFTFILAVEMGRDASFAAWAIGNELPPRERRRDPSRKRNADD